MQSDDTGDRVLRPYLQDLQSSISEPAFPPPSTSLGLSQPSPTSVYLNLPCFMHPSPSPSPQPLSNTHSQPLIGSTHSQPHFYASAPPYGYYHHATSTQQTLYQPPPLKSWQDEPQHAHPLQGGCAVLGEAPNGEVPAGRRKQKPATTTTATAKTKK
ncbi:hypothetical protein FRB95_004932 [Tulasnella sp. JGI-2019a]|nr:hypothetical protein FRB95_004932 [Tulasnella sp. JGI-2019a]